MLERAEEPEQTAMLTAMMRHLEAKAIDEALDLFQALMATRLLNTAKRKTEKRLSTLPKLEKASRTLAGAAKVLFEELELVETHGADLNVAALRAVVEEVAPRRCAERGGHRGLAGARGQEHGRRRDAGRVAARYATARPFLALLGEPKAWGAASAGKRSWPGCHAFRRWRGGRWG